MNILNILQAFQHIHQQLPLINNAPLHPPSAVQTAVTPTVFTRVGPTLAANPIKPTGRKGPNVQRQFITDAWVKPVAQGKPFAGYDQAIPLLAMLIDAYIANHNLLNTVTSIEAITDTGVTVINDHSGVAHHGFRITVTVMWCGAKPCIEHESCCVKVPRTLCMDRDFTDCSGCEHCKCDCEACAQAKEDEKKPSEAQPAKLEKISEAQTAAILEDLLL